MWETLISKRTHLLAVMINKSANTRVVSWMAYGSARIGLNNTQNSSVVVEEWHDSNLLDLIGILEFHYMSWNNVYLYYSSVIGGTLVIKSVGKGWRKNYECQYSTSLILQWPFILAIQAHHVFYTDPTGEWSKTLSLKMSFTAHWWHLYSLR